MRKFGIVIVVGGLALWAVIGALVVLDIAQPELITPTPARVMLQATRFPTATPTNIPATSTPFPTATRVITTPIVEVTAKPATETPIPTTTDAPTVIPSTAISVADTSTAIPPAASSTTPITNGTGCTPPAGWVAYTVTSGDTLFGFQLGSENAVSVDQIMQANCMKSKMLALGQVVYLPPGVGAKSPKVDDAPIAGTSLPEGFTRKANCPCTISIREGWRREQIAAAVDAIPVGFTGRDFLAVTNPGVAVGGFGFLSSKPASASLEGFLYPGSYTLQNDTTAQGFRDMLLRAFDSAIPEGLRASAGARNLSFYEAVILASIVQRESYAPVEQVKVASVMYNRMAAGKALSVTVTVQYAIGRPGAWWPKVTGADLKNRSKYNTYIWLGLPPTPIGSPNFDAINSTLNPAQTSYQYFSASCDGPGNFYTETYAEFEAKLRACGQIK
jgi:cell division protein YceG involved in septum cleavage/LysM repeat protein